MTLRQKLLLAQVPLALALAFVGLVGVWTISLLGESSEAILRENYRSVLAAQRMKDALDRLHDAAALRVAGDPGALSRIDPDAERRRFAAELQLQEGNLSEAGEENAVRRLRAAWASYEAWFERFVTLTERKEARKLFIVSLDPAFRAVRDGAEAILLMNQDAMIRKSDHAKHEARRMNRLMILASLVAFVLGVVVSASATNRLLYPLGALTGTVNRIGEGDFETRLEVSGRDELALLAASVNRMAARLTQYRQSSLGELLVAQQAAQAAIDGLPDPVLVYDLEGHVLNVNRAAEELLGSTPATEAGFVAGIAPEMREVLARARAHVLRGRGAYTPRGLEEAVHVPHPNGERYLLPRATAVYGEDGSITGAAVVLQDVTRLRRVDELRNDLVATVAHELRSPLTSLRMAIHLMIERTPGALSEKQLDLMYAAREDCERLQSVVDELLDLARIQSGHVPLEIRPSAVESLANAAADAWRNTAEREQLSLRVEIVPGLGEVAADRERIQLVFSNLIGNAIRHTAPGGTITIRALPSDGSVRFEVSDTGEGIAIEHQRLIFERFVRIPERGAGGAGLGLSIAKEIVEAHGGEIGVESAPGKGATFWFTLPRRSAPAEPSAAPAFSSD